MGTKIIETVEATLEFYDFTIKATGGKFGEISDWEFDLTNESRSLLNKTYYYNQELIMDEEQLQEALVELMVHLVQKRSGITFDYAEYEEEETE